MIPILDLTGAILILTGLYLVGSRKYYGFLIAALGCIFHTMMAVLLGLPGLAVLCILIILLDVRNYRNLR